MKKKNPPFPDEGQVLSRKDYQEILLARMAAGDLYANETRLKLRHVDMLLDKLRDKPIYPHPQELTPTDTSPRNPE